MIDVDLECNTGHWVPHRCEGECSGANKSNVTAVRRVSGLCEMTRMKIDQDLIDRLVDGEVSEDERRRIVSALAHDPELSRRVALAFLEAQEWRRILNAAASALSSEQGTVTGARPTGLAVALAAPEKSGVTDVRSRPAQNLLRRYLGTLVAMACSFALVFGAVWWMAQPRQEKTVSAGSEATAAAAGAALSPGQSLIAQSAPSQGQVASAGKPAATPFQMVAVPVAVGNDGTLTSVDIPVIPVADGEQINLWPDSVVPPEVLDVLRKSGHIIRQQRHLMPVSLPDGRQTIIPVDQVEIQMPEHNVR